MSQMSPFYLDGNTWNDVDEYLEAAGDNIPNKVNAELSQVFQNPELIPKLEDQSSIKSCLKDFFSKLNLINIVSWNVNGIRSRILDSDNASKCKIDKTKVIEPDSNLGRLLDELDPEIICFQETKCSTDYAGCFSPSQYPYRYWNCSKGVKGRQGNRYSGTAIWSKIEPTSVIYNIPTLSEPDQEGRVIILEFAKFVLINTYNPNSGTNEEYRLGEWDKAMEKYLTQLAKQNKKVVWCGDLNVARDEMDVHFSDPDSNSYKNYKQILKGKRRIAGFLPEERESLNKILQNGYTDVYRDLYPNRQKAFTWWDPKIPPYRIKNRGWRIDYFILSDSLLKEVISCKIWKDIGTYSKPQGSDHAPISLTINLG